MPEFAAMMPFAKTDGWQRFALAAGAGLQAGAATQPARTTYSGQFTAYDPYGQYRGNYFGQATTSDPAAQAMAQSAINRDARTQAAMLDNRTANKMQELSAILRTTTINPGKLTGDIVELNRGGVKDYLNVSVTFDREQHLFRFQ